MRVGHADAGQSSAFGPFQHTNIKLSSAGRANPRIAGFGLQFVGNLIRQWQQCVSSWLRSGEAHRAISGISSGIMCV